MDSSGSTSWIIHHGYGGANSSSAGNSGFMCGYAAGCVESAAGLQSREEQQELLAVSSQMQHHLNQISMHMSMDDEPLYGNGAAVDMHQSGLAVDVDFLALHHAGAAGSFPSSSTTSSSFPSASLSCSPESSGHLRTAHAGAAGVLQYPEVSSQVPLAAPPPVVLPYAVDDDVNFDDLAALAAPEMSTGAFRRYTRHLGPRRRPKPGAAPCGQRMIKTAMSMLSNMHTAMRYRQHYSYQQAAAAAEAAAETPSSGNQLQHMISERKRREKLSGSFHALKAVLPTGPKKDKASILITAREYVTSLQSKLRDLEEKNRELESRLAARRAWTSDEEDAAGKVEIEINRDAAEEPRETCTVKIAAARPACSNTSTDVVLRTLQYLRDNVGHDVTLVAMSTSDGAADVGGPHRPTLTLQLKSASGAKWEEEAVKKAVAKAVAETLPPPPPPQPQSGPRGDDRPAPWRRPRPASPLNEL